MKNTATSSRGISRRHFLSAAAVAATPFIIVPRHVLGGVGNTPPSEKLNIAGIGIGGMGQNDIAQVAGENIVALCDVDDVHAGPVFAKYPNAKRYRDFRKMFDEQKDIDAVIVATPDHLHAIISMTAIQMGKHVYCEKPLTHTVYQARKLTEAARKAKVATQMGNHGHSGEAIRLVCEWIADGAIGPVREVQAWTTLPRGIWPQGLERPTDTPPVPDTLDWDLFLGPAPERPYHPAYHPFKWRGWWDFGTGALGDQACHTLDVPFWALNLGAPTKVEACSTPMNADSFPMGSIVRWDFPARGDMPPVKVSWYDGGLLPPRPKELPADRRMGNEYGGVIFIGDKGKLLCGTFGENPRLLPDAAMDAYKRPEKTMPRSKGHHQDWIDACKGNGTTGSHFDYAGPLTEMALLGNIALKTGKVIEWDALNLTITNEKEANQYINPTARPGWAL
jgi:hypothetical protein